MSHSPLMEFVSAFTVLLVFLLPAVPLLGLAYLTKPFHGSLDYHFYSPKDHIAYQFVSEFLFGIAGCYILLISLWFILSSVCNKVSVICCQSFHVVPLLMLLFYYVQGYEKFGWYHQMLHLYTTEAALGEAEDFVTEAAESDSAALRGDWRG